MNPTAKKVLLGVLGVLVGFFAGMLVNGGIIFISGKVIALPEGVDPNNLESIKEHLHLYGPQHFVMPFLAHALGTLVGAFLAARIAISGKLIVALVIGAFFLAGGIWAATLIPAPNWFIVLDLVVAYIPMALLGAKLGGAGKAV